jgi:hypothetical protein
VRPLDYPQRPVVYRTSGRIMHLQASRLPSYRLHKPTGLAVVTIGGHDVYLGKHVTDEKSSGIRLHRLSGSRPFARR